MKKYVSGLTFHGGSPSWKFAAHRLCMQSEKFEAFSEFSIYNPRKLSLEFKMQHKNLIERHPRGFGLWIWKPQILLQQFRSYPCAEFYFYQDAGGELYSTTKSRRIFQHYLERAEQFGVFAFQSEHKTFNYTKGTLLQKYVENDLDTRSNQCMAGSLIVSRSFLTHLIDGWSRLMSNYENLVDPINTDSESSEFIAHRHDQSCLDLFLKMRKIPLFADTTSWSIPELIDNDCPIWNVRNNSRSSVVDRRNLRLSDRVQLRAYRHIPRAFKSNSVTS